MAVFPEGCLFLAQKNILGELKRLLSKYLDLELQLKKKSE